MPCKGCKDPRPIQGATVHEWDFFERVFASLPRLASEPSCMECVEKHLGVAQVLAGEVFDGHPGHLKLIGNLRLAEEHSQDWPALHDALREARRGYQSRRTMPDWAALERLAAAIR
jgi:hypothetical protein